MNYLLAIFGADLASISSLLTLGHYEAKARAEQRERRLPLYEWHGVRKRLCPGCAAGWTKVRSDQGKRRSVRGCELCQ